MEHDAHAITSMELEESPGNVERLDEGLMHATYAVDSESGRYVLQISDPSDVDALRRGLWCYRLLHDSAVPVPGIITDTVRVIDGSHYILVERLPGTSAKLDISPAKVRDAGRLLARIHTATGFERAGRLRTDGRGCSITPFENGCLSAWLQARSADSAEQLKDGGLGAPGEAVERLGPRLAGGLCDDFAPVLCHNDYSPDNVLFEDEQVTGVLDFDFAYAGHNQRDLAKAANAFWMHDPTADWNVRETLYEGYREASGLDPSFEELEPLYRAEAHAGTIAGMLSRGLLSESQQTFYSDTIVAAVERALDG